MNFRAVQLILLLFSTLVFSQIDKDYQQNALAEKIYLQLDNQIYTSDKTIWFKAVLANAASHSLEISSSVLYVDLINPKNEIVESKIVKVNKGIGKGHFDLDRSYSNGTYQIRAYTEWNKNFEDDFVTKKTIKIISEDNKTSEIVRNQEKKIDKQKLPKQDSVILKFFPEGGKIVASLKSKVGFKATDIYGNSTQVEGNIINDKGEVITSFKSNRVGLGSFVIDSVESSKTYKAKLIKTQNNQLYDLPKVELNGYTLSVSKHKKFIVATVKHNTNLRSKITLSASVRGTNYYKKTVSLIDGRYIFSIPKTMLPEGVTIFKLENDASLPIAERLYFNLRKEDRLNIEVSLPNKEISKREQLSFDLAVKNSKNELEEAHNSILVYDKNLFGEIESKRENILAFFLLSSDIKGKIEEASSYFLDTTDLDIDDLMLTQGWRNYKYTKSQPKKLNYKLESGLSISGVINKKNKNSKKDSLDLMLMTFGDDTSIYTGKVKVPNNFNFQIGDLYGGERKLVIKPTGLTDKEIDNYNILLKKKKKLEPDFRAVEARELIEEDSLIDTILLVNKKQKFIENDYYLKINGVTQLDEVIIDAYKMTPKRKEMFEKYGKPDVVIDGKEINEKTNKYSTGLYSNLVGFHDKVFIRKDAVRNYYAETTNGGKGHVNMVLVDGIAVAPDNYFLIQRINPKEVTSFEIIDNPSRARQLYASIYGTYPYGDFQASIIAIYTKAGKGLYGALDVNDGINVDTIDTFSIEKEFYVPDHTDRMASTFTEPDLRSTIYWRPNIISEKNKPLSINYSHSDDIGEYLVVIESITKDGKIGYETLEYKVTGPKN